jgi:Domain of unknown function (DUF4440)
VNFRIAILVLLFAFAKLLFAAPCAAYPAGKWKLDKASALEFEQVWLRVLTQKNVAALDCMLDAEFKDTSMKGGLRPKAQVLRELPGKRPGDDYQQKLVDLEADIIGDTAVVHGVNLISDQQGHEVLRIRFTDVLRFAEGRWLAVSAQETAEQQQR